MTDEMRRLTGRGCYVDDITLPNQARGIVLRSLNAHARLVSVDTAAAARMPGVLLILTGRDVIADGLKPIPLIPHALAPPDISLYNVDGSDLLVERPTILATDSVRHIGEPIAFVVAETVEAAKDAAEAIEVVHEPLPPVSTIAVDARTGQPPATRAGFAEAEHVVQLEMHVPFDAGTILEPRAVLAAWNSATGLCDLDIGGGAVARPKELAFVLGVAPEQVRIRACEAESDVGPRTYVDREIALAAWAARRLGRPVKWTAECGDMFANREERAGFAVEVELAVSADGRLRGLHGSNSADLGACTVSFVPLTRSTELMTGVYRLPAVLRARGLLSNAAPVVPRRGACVPETLSVLELLIDQASREIGIDRVELRRRNLIATQPHRNIFGVTFDSGDYAASLDEVLRLSDWNGYRARQRQSAARGLKRGRGIAASLRSTARPTDTHATYPHGWQVCEVEVDPETGEVEIDRCTSVGEAGRAPFLNAIVDALSDYGVLTIEMPCTAERVWRAIQQARGSEGARGTIT